jgi:transcriptional regulator with XRE-family HTH domain
VNLSKFVLELFELSGMTKEEFCKKLDICENQFNALKNGDQENTASLKTLFKAAVASLFTKKAPDEFIHNKLTQAHAIIVTVGESEDLADHQQISLSVASELVMSAKEQT